MITCSLRGQIGNQCFQIATTIAHALRNNTTYAFPYRSGKRDQFPNHFSHLQQVDGDIFRDNYKERKFGVYEPIPDSKDQILQGYFQSEKYFKDYRQEVLQALNLNIPYPHGLVNGVVAIHVRRQDYLRFAYKYNLTTIEYLIQAMDYFLRCSEDYKFMFFSDDIQWCKDNFKGEDRYLYCEEKDPKKSLGLMANCEHGIIGPSSFGWWGNWIADNNDNGRIVIAPQQWFNPNYNKLSSQDIVPENWVKI